MPESVGVPGNKLVLGKHSGRNALNDRLVKLGFPVSKEELQKIYEAFTQLADAKKNVTTEEIIALAKRITRHDGKVKEETVTQFIEA